MTSKPSLHFGPKFRRVFERAQSIPRKTRVIGDETLSSTSAFNLRHPEARSTTISSFIS
jgi:hypothetical protein